MSTDRGVAPTPLVDLNAFQRDTLRVVAALESPNGQDIARELEQYYGEIYSGRLYPSIQTLDDKGLIVNTADDNRSNCLELTSRGVRELKAHRAWVSHAWGADE